MKLLRLLLLVVLAAPALSQSEDEPYFALNTQRTFAANAKPSVMLNAWNVDALEMRVYKIHDVTQFFEQLESAHEFGGRVARPPRERTMLERIHAWKHGLRTGIRLGLRGQFTESPSAHFESVLPKESTSAPAAKGTQYAVAPVLNSQQLVLAFNHPVRSHSRWESQTVDLAVKDRGVYLVEAVRGDLRAYTILMITDLVMVTKTGSGRIVNFLADRATGEPVAGAQIVLLGRDTRKATAESDKNGLAEIAFAGGRADDLRLVARRGENYAVNTLAGYAFETSREQWSGYLYTDRPVYRPGHTMHFKGVLRQKTAAGYKVPAGKGLTVVIQDAEQKEVYRKTLTTNANGSVRDDFTVPAGASLGSYFISAGDGGEESFMSGSFDVEEYKKPEYEVRVTPAKPRVVQGESVQAVIDSRYYFGEPVAGAHVKYSVYRGRYWFPYGYDADDEENAGAGQGDAGDNDYGDEQILDEEGQLDSDGKRTIHFDTTVSDHKTDYRYRIEARVTDEAKREIIGRGGIVATYGSFMVNARPYRYFYQPNATAQVNAEARDYDGKPVRTRVHVELVRWTWRNHQAPQTTVVASTDVDTGADGSATAELTLPAQGGTYRVRVTARTPEGRDVENTAPIWVAGGGEADFGDPNRKSVQLIPDKKAYKPGDTAKVLIVTGKPNTPVLVSIEGRDLRKHQVMRSSDSTVVLEVPVTAQDEPGIWVNAQFVRKGAMYQGAKYLKAPPDDHKLNIAVATDKPQYKPGETAQYTLQVTNADGRPAAGAELSLGVVDEAIYAIRRDTTQDPLAYFFGHEWNMVHTEDSLNYYFSGEAGKRRMRLAALREPSRLAQLKPDRMVQPKIRKAFPDTAFWNADLVTDASGKAQAKVEFPDSLTTWRATARGITPDTRVGAVTAKTIVRKNLILRLAVPRFFVQGDELVISALVHNYLTTEKNVRVSLDLKGLDVIEGATREIRVLPRAEAKLDWRVRVPQVRTAVVTGKALTDEESDALELELPVNIPGVKLGDAKGGTLNAGAATQLALTFPAKVQPGSRRLSVRVSPSIAGSLFSALDYLITFPYGCVEQTMSSFLPNIVVTQAVKDFGVKLNLEQEGVQEKIRAGLDRLYSFQHEDGGWGWWETDESHPFMTAYVVAGLAQAKAAGVQIEEQRIENAANWLTKSLAVDAKLAADLRAYMVYSLTLAGRPQPPSMQSVYEQRAKLSPYGIAVLGLAFEQVKDARAGELAAALEQTAKQESDEVSWPSARDQLLDFSEDATPEATAFAVKFLSRQRAQSPLLPKAALWLMNHRNEGYWWNSTKQTAMVIYGLTDYLKLTNELNPNLTVNVWINDQPVISRKLDHAALVVPEFALDETKLQPGENRVRISTSGEGRLYYSVREEYYSADERFQKTGSAQLNVLRDYFRLAPTKTGEKIVYDLVPLNGPVAAGDTLAVRLTVTGTEWKYLMVEDPIPAGTEFIERDSSYELKERPPWWQFFFTRRELHDDRMAIFQTYFPQGQQQYFYLLKVVNPGAFHVSPARVQPMYNSGVMATSDARRLEAK